METRQHQIDRIMKRNISEEVEVFLQQIERVGLHLSMLYDAWQNLNSEDSDTASTKYPFHRDLLELIADYWNWYHEIRSCFTSRVRSFSPTVTVKDLKKVLDELDDDVQIVVEKVDGYDWLNIREVEIPDGESMFTLTFHTADDFRVTQL